MTTQQSIDIEKDILAKLILEYYNQTYKTKIDFSTVVVDFIPTRQGYQTGIQLVKTSVTTILTIVAYVNYSYIASYKLDGFGNENSQIIGGLRSVRKVTTGLVFKGNFPALSKIDGNTIVTISPPPPAPPAPTNLVATGYQEEIDLSWDASAGAVSYSVFQGLSPGIEASIPVMTGLLTPDATILGLIPGKRYYFRVAAVNANGVSPLSAEVNTTTLSPPVTPANLTADGGIGQITLTWDPSVDAVTYNVLQGTAPNAESLTPVETDLTDSTVVITGLDPNERLYFKVIAINANGSSSPSNEATAVTDSLPDAPTHVIAVGGNKQVALNWTSSAGSDYYGVYMGTSPSGEALTPIQNFIYSNSLIITNLTPGVRYYFYVKGSNAVGDSAPSMEASAVVNKVPSAPSGLQVTLTGRIVRAKWNPVQEAVTYKFYTSLTPGDENLATPVSNLALANYLTDPLTPGSTYYFKVSAVSPAGESVLSNEVSVSLIDIPATPLNLVSSFNDNDLVLSWDVASRAASYNVYRSATTNTEGASTPISGILTNKLVIPAKTLVAGQTYYFEVSGVNASGEGSLSTELAVLIPTIYPSDVIPATIGSKLTLPVNSLGKLRFGSFVRGYPFDIGFSLSNKYVFNKQLRNQAARLDGGIIDGYSSSVDVSTLLNYTSPWFYVSKGTVNEVVFYSPVFGSAAVPTSGLSTARSELRSVLGGATASQPTMNFRKANTPTMTGSFRVIKRPHTNELSVAEIHGIDNPLMTLKVTKTNQLLSQVYGITGSGNTAVLIPDGQCLDTGLVDFEVAYGPDNKLHWTNITYTPFNGTTLGTPVSYPDVDQVVESGWAALDLYFKLGVFFNLLNTDSNDYATMVANGNFELLPIQVQDYGKVAFRDFTFTLAS